jgi:general nucleoside transport system permease protein
VLNHHSSTKDYILRPLLASLIGLLIGGLFVLLTGNSPLKALKILFNAGFGCESGSNCAILTTLQFTTPLILVGLSAAVAFRAGIFSIGQAGQMILGAAAANWVASSASLGPILRPTAALILSASFGLVYGIFPALFTIYFNINAILSTIFLNYIAFYLINFIPSGYGRWIPETARLASIAYGTKLNTGFFIAIAVLILIFIWLWRTASGYNVRMAGQNPVFAKAGGIKPHQSILLGMMLSGALAGLAGGIEILGVHYHFVQNFTGSDVFDGVMVALLGFSHPIGILFSAFVLAGIRLAAMTGLSIQMGIPRSIGGMLISTMVIVMGADGIYIKLKSLARNAFLKLRSLFRTKKRAGEHPTR